MCGIIKPTKPIRPLTDTTVPIIKEHTAIRIFLIASVFIPSVFAVSSPISITFKSLEKIYKIPEPIITTGNTSSTCLQLAAEILPITQKIIFSILSLLKIIKIEFREDQS